MQWPRNARTLLLWPTGVLAESIGGKSTYFALGTKLGTKMLHLSNKTKFLQEISYEITIKKNWQ